MFKVTIAAFLVLFSHAALAAPQALPVAASEKTSKSSRAVFEARASNVQTYDELLAAIRRTRAASAERIEALVRQEKVREAWETGKLIDEHILLQKERAEYGRQVIERLAKDLGTDKTELYRMLEFARTYPIVGPAQQLSWSHFEALLSLNNPDEVRELAEKAEKEKWTRDRLREEVRRRKAGALAEPKPLEAKPGKLHTYRVVRDFAGEDKDELVIDLGFSNYYRPPGKFPFQEGDILKWNSEAGTGPGARPAQGAQRRAPLQKMSNAAPADLYTFEAEVIRVLDGDTFAASVDLGFGFTTVQTLRLRGLDAPELESAEGKESKAFVEKSLRSFPHALSGNPQTGSPISATKIGGSAAYSGGKTFGDDKRILIKTVKSDKYDRYLADVWAGDKYLNQELIDKGLAVRASE